MYFAVLFVAAVLLAPAAAQWEPNCASGRKAMVHLFEWRWDDIAAECERFLGPKGFCGVQVSPPNECIPVFTSNEQRPWWERYQPVSYKTYSRSGDETAFNDMVRRCNNVGVRIYVDIVMNHMTGAGQKGNGIGGTYFDADALNFPGVPYSSPDFNSKTSSPSICTTSSGNIENYNDKNQVRNCRLVGLVDLNQGKTYVQGKILEWLNNLINAGVAGFRFDAAKHMWPADMELILTKMNNLPTTNGWFSANSRPFVYQEVIDYGGEAIKASEYYYLGRITEFNYGKYVSEAFRGYNQLKNLKTFGQGWGYLMPDGNALVFIDNHDNQRGHGGGGNVATFWESRLYKKCVTYMLAWPYGVARVMSSYSWDRKFVNGKDVNDWQGPPHDSNYNIKNVIVNSDQTCGNGWICEHRWRQITNMVEFRNVAGSEGVANWWDDGDNQIGFSRGSKGYYIVNGSSSKNLDATLYTSLPAGRYCDVISGNRASDKQSCSGSTITVGSDGKARFTISASQEDPMIAIHINSKLD